MQAALAALATLGVTVTLDGDCGRTELAATSPAPYNSATKCTKLKNIDELESICLVGRNHSQNGAVAILVGSASQQGLDIRPASR